VFNNNREIYNILLYNKSSKDSINQKRFYITIDTDIEILIINNKSIYSTI